MRIGEHRKTALESASPATYAFAGVEVDAAAHRLSRDGREIAIEPKAFAVLLEFLSHPGQLLSRDQLLDVVWGHSFITPATLNRIIAQLRKALADDSEAPRCIQTVHGLGYRFIAALQQVQQERTPELRFAPPARARLPERTEPLIGRDGDIEALQRILQEHRLVTITGPGGLGKTQAALETARTIAADFPDGAWLFDCTSHTQGDALVRWLAGMFDIHATTEADQLIAQLAELLQPRRVLLVFDNCERVAEPLGRTVASLLSACAGVHILVTSQQRLNCAGESLYGLPPLQVPQSGEWATDEQLASLSSIPAVRLLLLRSQACASGFALTRDNAVTVAEICRRVAGFPLALELAAARLRLLSPEQLLARMDARLLNLAEANPGRPARHQTLRALIEWSFALLSEKEQALLCGLSIFAGACTLGGASAIGTALGLEDPQTLELLVGLIDKSLLAVDGTTNPPSYRLLDSVRLFALERLVAGRDETRIREAHLLHFVRFSGHAKAELLSDRQPLWFDRIRREWANLHIAFEYAIGHVELADHALELTGNLCWYYRAHTNYEEPVALLERALRAAPESSPARAQALVASGMVLHHFRKSEQAMVRLGEGAALAEAQGNRWLAGTGQAIRAFELAISGDFPAAERAVNSALSAADALDDGWLRSNALLSRGIGHSFRGRHEEAVTCMVEAFACVATHGDYFQRAYTQINLALQRFYVGDLPGAAREWLPNLDEFIRAHSPRGAAGVVEGSAYLAAERGEFEAAARFLTAAARMRRITGGPLVPQWCKAQEAAEKKILEALGSDVMRSRSAGGSARFEDVVAEARALLAEIAGQPERTGASNPSGS